MPKVFEIQAPEWIPFHPLEPPHQILIWLQGQHTDNHRAQQDHYMHSRTYRLVYTIM